MQSTSCEMPGWKKNARLDEAQVGIKLAGRIIDIIYADDTTPLAESKEDLKSILMVKESEKAGLKLNIQKTKTMAEAEAPILWPPDMKS